MILSDKDWRNCLLFCGGLFVGTAFCMKWLEAGFYYHGSLFTIIGLEILYKADRVMDILYHLEEPARTMLRAHLYVDFVFMAGAYGGISSLLMMARNRAKSRLLRNVMLVLAALQLLAWGCDIRENIYLLDWLTHQPRIGTHINTYHFIVILKWTLALTGVLSAIPFLFGKRKS